MKYYELVEGTKTEIENFIWNKKLFTTLDIVNQLRETYPDEDIKYFDVRKIVRKFDFSKFGYESSSIYVQNNTRTAVLYGPIGFNPDDYDDKRNQVLIKTWSKPTPTNNQFHAPISQNTKYCPRCNKTLDISEFHKDVTRPDGYRPYCKSCRKQHNYNI